MVVSAYLLFGLEKNMVMLNYVKIEKVNLRYR